MYSCNPFRRIALTARALTGTGVGVGMGVGEQTLVAHDFALRIEPSHRWTSVRLSVGVDPWVKLFNNKLEKWSIKIKISHT